MTVSAQDGLLVNDYLDWSESNVATKLTDPQHGSVSVNSDGSFSYTPEALYPGFFWFDYQVTDGYEVAYATAYIEVGKVAIEKQMDYLGGDVWIGEGISLRATIDGGTPLGEASYSWSVSGNAIQNYVNDYYTASDDSSQPRAYVVPLAGAFLTSEYISFHWVTQGAKTASVTVTMNGQTSTAQVEYNVQKPDFDFSATTSGVNLYDYLGAPSVSLGKLDVNPQNYVKGITFNVQFPNPDIVGDDFRLVQTASISGTRTLVTGVVEEISGSGVDPDHFYPEGYDTPSIKLMGNARSYSLSYSFDTYLKWRGPRGGIYVPLSLVSWSWNFTATSNDGVNWTLTSSGGTLNQTIPGVDGVYFPTYYGSIQHNAGGRTEDGDLGGWAPQE